MLQLKNNKNRKSKSKSKSNKKNRYDVKANKRTRKNISYNIHNNRSIPYVVKVSSKIEVFCKETNTKILDTPFIKVFLGDNLLNDPLAKKKGKGSLGNSILVKVSIHNYIYIGSEIYSFETEEEIHSYFSPIGNSDVPYPYAIGDSLTYFMLDKKTVPTELLDINKDGYSQFYGYNLPNEIKNRINKSQKKFKVKIIHKKNV